MPVRFDANWIIGTEPIPPAWNRLHLLLVAGFRRRARPLQETRSSLASRFRGGAWMVWQVVAVAQEQYGIRHYRISDAKDPSDVRLISEKALADPKFYQLIEET